MKKFFTASLITAALLATGGAARADEIITEARTVDGRAVKVVLDGIVDLKLKQGAPALVVSGDKRYIQKITVTQNGDTIRIGTENMRGIHMGSRNLKAELTLPSCANWCRPASVRPRCGDSTATKCASPWKAPAP